MARESSLDRAGSDGSKAAEATIAIPDYISPQTALRAVLATDFSSFIRYTFDIVRPGIPFRSNWHIDAMAYSLSQVAFGEVKRLIITVPPRNLKSICASVALPAWFLGRNPSERVVAVSYSDDLAKLHANDFRKVVSDPLYKEVFPNMRVQRDTEREFTTTRGGKRYTTSIEGVLTGRGGNLFIIDDPLKLGDAFSKSVREKSIDWYRSTLVTRADDKQAARIVVVMQRVHQEDLVGYLQRQGGFKVLDLPAVAMEPARFATGPRSRHWRNVGEILHPERDSVDVLLGLKKDMGSTAFSSQYQQMPVPAGGTFIKSKWLKFYSEIPSLQQGDRIVLSWDIALSEREGADYSAGVVLLSRGETFHVLEVVKGQFPFPQLIQKIAEMCRRFPRSTLLIEESAISIGVIQEIRHNDINVVTVKPTKEKESRVISQIGLFEGGSIFLPERAAWRDDLISELLSFPAGHHDDQVDALVQGLDWQRSQWLGRIRVRPTSVY